MKRLAVCYEDAIRRARHHHLTSSMHRVRIMNQPHLDSHSKSPFYVVDNSVPLLLLLKLESMIRWQIDQARQQMDWYQSNFSRPLSEGLKNLARYQTLRKVEFNVQVFESNTQFLIWVGKICKKSYVTIQKLWRIEVDDTEACLWGIKHGNFRFNSNKDD